MARCDGIIVVKPTDTLFMKNLYDYIDNYAKVRELDKVRYIEHHQERMEKYYWERRWWGLVSPRRIPGHNPFGIDDVDDFIRAQDSWGSIWSTYESRFTNRTTKAATLLDSLQKGNEILVEHDYYEMINSDRRTTYLAPGRWGYFV